MSDSTNEGIPSPHIKGHSDLDDWLLKVPRPIRRESSSEYMVFVLLSFIATVTLTRLGLSLIGYPMLGDGEIHIAHVLWGGLLLFTATLLLLLISNRQVYEISAALSGIGLGLFIDEVGKFITLQNDYFYPLAAPIIYIFFMLLLILMIRLRRQMRSTVRAEFNRALETLQDWVDHPLGKKEQALLLQRLTHVSSSSNPQLSTLAAGILHAIQSDTRPPPIEPAPHWQHYVNKLDRWFSERGLRLSLAIGFFLMALIALKNPANDLLNPHLPEFLDSLFFGVHSGRWYGSESAPALYLARIALEITLGILLFITALLLTFKHKRIAVPLGFGLLIIYLATIDTLLFYFEQFSTIAFVIFQYLLLFGLIYYRTRFLKDYE